MQAGEYQRASGALAIAAVIDRSPRSLSLVVISAYRASLGDLAMLFAGMALYDYGDEFRVVLDAQLAKAVDHAAIMKFVESIDQDAGGLRTS
jgi:hypothetical protein